MKQKDIILIIVVVFVSGVISFALSNWLFAPSSDRQEEVEVVQPISTDFQRPDPKYFNANSINPTQIIRIGPEQNTQPF